MGNVAIYSRKSKFTGKGESIENQILKCKQFIEFKFSMDPSEVEIFIDEGFTGRNTNRPQYKELMKKVKDGEIEHIVLYQLNRFGRNARDIHNSLQECMDHNCIIYSAQEGFDSATSFGRAIIGIMASLAQLETEQLGERVKDNMYTLAKMGRWLGGQSPLGFNGEREYYIDDNGKERSVTKLVENQEEMNIVKAIYNKYLEEKSLSQVGKWSLTNNFKGKNGGNLDKSALNVILQNPVYVKANKAVFDFFKSKGYDVYGVPNGHGMLRYGKENNIVASAKHKGIIPASDWLEVQSILSSNAYKAPRLGKTNTALLTGILKCKCGSNMRVTYGKANKNGLKQFYYTCNMKNASGGTRCNSKNINGIKLEENLVKYLTSYNKDIFIKEIKNILATTEEINKANDIDNINLSIDNSNKSITKLLNKLKLVDDEDISKIILDEIKYEKNKIKELESKKKVALENESSLALTQQDLFEIATSLEDFCKNFDKLTFEEKKKRLSYLIDTIIYDEGTFSINFNIKKKLDNCFNLLSNLSNKFLSHFSTSCRSYMYRNSSWSQCSKTSTWITTSYSSKFNCHWRYNFI